MVSQRSSPAVHTSLPQHLSYQETYPCPVCGHHRLTGLALTEAFGCGFCRHIFAADLTARSIKLLDGVRPLSWYWQNGRWQQPHSPHTRVNMVIWGFVFSISCLPALLIALSNYMFPPLDQEGLGQFSLIWTLATLAAHAGIVCWLMAEHYQWPWYVTAKIKLGR